MRTALRYRSVQMEAAGEDGPLTGYATLFDAPYPIAPGLTETVKRGAFDAGLRERDGIVPVFWNHGWAKTNEEPVGWAKLREDATGVRIEEAHLFTDTPRGSSIDQSTRARSLREWSLGFRADKIRKRAANEDIEIGDIVELSVVVRGAAPTTMGFRSDDEVTRLREAGIIDADAEIIDETEPTEPPEGESEGEDAGGDETVVIREQAYGLLQHPGVRDAIRQNFNKE